MKKGKWIIAAVAVIFAVIMFFLSSNEDFFDSREEITFWQFWDPEWLKPAIETFEKENPGYRITVERLTWEDGFNKIVTAMAADSAPDVIEIGSTWVAGFGKDGGLKELNTADLANKMSNLRSAFYKDKYYALPWTLSTNALFYNKKLLRENGFDKPPENWEELLAQSRAIHKPDMEQYGFGVKSGRYSSWQKFMPFAWSNGANLINDDWKTTGVNLPEFKEALKYYNELRKAGLFDENIVVRKAFQEGKLAFMPEEPGQIKKFRSETPDLEFGVIPLPMSPKGLSKNFSGAQMLAVTKNTKNREMAEKFVRFMVLPDNAFLITKVVTTLFPAHKDASELDYYQNLDDDTKVFLEVLKTSVAPPAHPDWVKIQEVFVGELEKVLYDKETVEEAMQKAEAAIIPLLEAE